MNPATPTLIDLTEFVYDLDVPREDWVPSLLETGLPLFDHGQGPSDLADGGRAFGVRFSVATKP